MDKLKKHFSDIENLIIYALFGVVFVLELFDDGFGRAVGGLAVIAFVISGWYFVFYLGGSIKTRNFSFGLSDLASGVYFVGYSVYWLSEHGFNRKAAFLAFPIFSGLILFFAFLFTASNSYKSLNKWEARMTRKLMNMFRREP